MQNLNHRGIIVALFLLWLSLTGTNAGWRQPIILLLNLLLWLGLIIWFCLCVPWKNDLLGLSLFGLICSVLLSAGLTSRWPAGTSYVLVLFGYLTIYYFARSWSSEAIQRGAFLAVVIYMILCCFGWENTNIMAFSLLGLAFLAFPVGGWGMSLFVALFNFVYLHSMGCTLALITGSVVLLWHHKSLLLRFGVVCSIFPILLFDWWGNRATYTLRIGWAMDAIRDFLTSPIWGIGPVSSYQNTWHAHNMVLSIAAELGIVGLLALAGPGWAVWRNRARLPIWAIALTAAFIVWSLVDEPLKFWGPGAMLMMAWSRMRRE